MAQERRPGDQEYYEPGPLSPESRQGDLFIDVPFPLTAYVEYVEEAGIAPTLVGPCSMFTAMLVTPTRSLLPERNRSYDHDERALVIVRPLQDLIESGRISEDDSAQVRAFDHKLNYMYLPALQGVIPESVALLYKLVGLPHEMIEGQRVARLTFTGMQQLQRKLVQFYAGRSIPRAQFQPPVQ